MAILSSTGVSGFLSSAKATGKQILNKVGRLIPEYIEDFVSGFAGHGWKIWERASGIWRIETDELVVRRTMIVFEMLISKIRCIKGALNISQGNGRIKTAELKEDGNWHITIEDEMSFVPHDFIRCQHFSNMAKFYWVEITDIINDNTTLVIPATEFTGSLEYKDGIEYVAGSGEMNIPEPGDEIIQFGNRVNKDRQSAIYLHADEGGQPAIDILFNIHSKSFEGCLNMRMGGSIPGEGDMKGFYCENGMIKGTVNNHVVYQIKPDGSAMFGDGSAQFNTDKSGHIAGGAISWQWDEAKGRHVCTMQDVVLTWDNLSEDAKENLKGEPGKDGQDGKNGDHGSDGLNGADGVDGKDGVNLVYKGELSSHPSNPQNGWYYRNTTDKKSYVYQDGAWYVMTVDGMNGKDGNDGLSIIWKGDSATPPTAPQKNWVYRDTDNGRVYIYNGTAWELMVADGNDGTDGTEGTDGLSVFITYNDDPDEVDPPTGDGTTGGWHTDATSGVVWMSQKVAEHASLGTWGNPIRIKGENAVFYLIEFEEDGNGVQAISAMADGVPKGESLTASLYKITSGKKELCGARRFTISAGSQIWEVIPPMGGGPFHTISINYGDSSVQSYTVTAYGDANTVIALATIHKVLDGRQGEQGNPGTDANLLPWIEKWNGYATELGSDYIVTPKMFSGKVETDENGTRLLTGIAQGKDCITASDGTTRTGIFALVDNEPVFELDPINKKYRFKGKVDADEGIFKNVTIEDGSQIGKMSVYNGFLRYSDDDYYVALGTGVLPGTSGSRGALWLEDKSTGSMTKTLVILNAVPSSIQGGFGDPRNNNIAVSIPNGTVRVSPGNLMDVPGVILAGRIGYNGDVEYQYGRKGRDSLNSSYAFGVGGNGNDYEIIHNLGHSNYTVQVTPYRPNSSENNVTPIVSYLNGNNFGVFFNDADTANKHVRSAFCFTVIGENT